MMIFNRGTFAALVAVATMALATIFGATPASATCLAGCVGNTSTTGQLTLSGQVATAGIGNAVFNGPDGGASYADKVGNATLDIRLGGEGGLCTTVDCATANGGLSATMSERIETGAYGLSETSGAPAQAAQQLASNGLIAAQFPNGFGIELGVMTAGAGQAGAIFAGSDGSAYANVEGVSSFTGNLEVDGVCPTCQSGDWSMNASVAQMGEAGAHATSLMPGTAAEAINNIGLNAAVTLNIGSTN